MTAPEDNSEFLSYDNFRLAWERVLRSQHHDSKDRLALRVFSTSVELNLRRIIEQIEARTYEPSPAPQIHIPKSSRTLRSLPVLSISDRVVYQAYGNVLARYAQADLSVVANRHVFAHLPSRPDEKFALKSWKLQFPHFVDEYERIWNEDCHWVVEADISSFYATIDHDLLQGLISERWYSDGEALRLLMRCLRRWTATDETATFRRGLPQGYETSDLLATLFLLPIDQQLVAKYSYVRYVDDIRILTNSRDRSSRALVDLDLALKAHALVLQAKKTGIEEITDINEEKNRLDRKLSQLGEMMRYGSNPQDKLRETFYDAWSQIDAQPVEADRALAFTLYRLDDSDSAVRDIAVKLIDILPWRSPVICKYLKNFENDSETIRALLGVVSNHKVYGWLLAQAMSTLSIIAPTNAYRHVSLAWISNQNLQWYQRLAAIRSLQNDDVVHAALYTAIQEESNKSVKKELITICAFQAYSKDSREETISIIRRAVEDVDEEVRMLGIWLYNQFTDINWEEINYRGRLGSLQELVPELSSLPGERPCFIKHTLRTVYDVEICEATDFQTIFGDYEGTVKELARAVPYYSTDPSHYIGFINSFNHRIAIALQSIIGTNIPNDQFNNILNSRDFRTRVPFLAAAFGECNEIRNRTSGFHPFASALGTWSQEVKHSTKERIHNGLKLAYQEFVDVLPA